MGSSVLRISLSPAPIQTPDQSSVKAFAPCSTTRSTAGALDAPAAASWRELMRDFDENNITAAVVDRFANTSDPRLKDIMSSLVRHLHAFARDVRLSFAEWSYAIDFLTRTGQICTDKRQEFILLSDTLGLSMLVDAIDHPASAGVTESTVLGPRARPR
jgi:hypothetical protein